MRHGFAISDHADGVRRAKRLVLRKTQVSLSQAPGIMNPDGLCVHFDLSQRGNIHTKKIFDCRMHWFSM